MDFTARYIGIEATDLVPAGSPRRAVGDVDRDGVRIGVSAKSAYDLFLSRSVQRAELIRAPDPNAAFELRVAGKVDVVAGVRQPLVTNAGKLPGSRVFDGRFMAIGRTLGTPKGRHVAAECLRQLREDA